MAEASPRDLFRVDAGAKQHIDEVFAFDRTVSRLLEMGSQDYQDKHRELRLAASAATRPKEDSSSTGTLYLELAEMATETDEKHQQHGDDGHRDEDGEKREAV